MLFDDIYNILNWLPGPIAGIITLFIIIKISTMGIINTKEKKWVIKDDVPYFRDIPTKDLELALWVGIKFNLIKDKYDFFGVMLLKWLKEDKISFKEIDGKIGIDFNTHFKTSDDYEREFYHLFLAVSGTNHYLEENEFVSYLLYSPEVVDKLYKSVLEKVKNELEKKDQIADDKKTLVKEIILGQEIKDLAMNMAGLKKFLKDFSNIETKKAEEVILWEYYLIYAQAFGMAKEVQEQFKKLYPNNEKMKEINLANSEIVNGLIYSIRINNNENKNSRVES